VENVYYLRALDDPGIAVWLVRGFGTATLHGSTTAIFAILAKNLRDRQEGGGFWTYAPGLGLAMLLHTLFNQLVLPPAAATGLILAVLPITVAWMFKRSETATRAWLGSGFDADLEVLEIIESGEVRKSRIGQYLESVRHRFPPAVVGDMLCLLQIRHELAIRAKALLIAREVGVEIPVGQGIRDKLKELEYLEKSIGKTGKLALTPLLSARSRDQWQISLLEK
jgi:hypothetical protein